MVNASERSRHERSVKRPLLLFCILFHPPPSSALLRSPALPSQSLSPVAEQKPSGTVQSPLQLQSVCVCETEEEIKVTVLSLHHRSVSSYVSICLICLFFRERTNGSPGLLGAVGEKINWGRRRNKTIFNKLVLSIWVSLMVQHRFHLMCMGHENFCMFFFFFLTCYQLNTSVVTLNADLDKEKKHFQTVATKM